MSNGPLILQQGIEKKTGAFTTDLLEHGIGAITADIVFVHGLRGDRVATWSKGDVCWPRDLLPQDLPNVRIITWGYDADVANVFKQSSHASIFGHAQSFLRDIARLRQKAEEKTRPIIFVGHSMGGLLIKTALIRSAECLHTGQNPDLGRIYKYTRGLLFLGTPHRGSEQTGFADILAKVASVTLRQPNKKLIEILRQDSDVLEGQRSSFSAISKDIPIACVCETVPMMGLGMVPEYSACFDGYQVEKDQIDASHMDMCKFSDPDDIGYKRLAGFLAGFVGDTLDERVEVFLRHLWFPEIRDREDDIRPAHAKTFEWILDSHSTKAEARDYIGWLSSPCDAHDSNRIFWVSGKAGSGKSTIMKYLFRDSRLKGYLRLWAKETPLRCIGFFIWDRGKSMMHKSREGMIRSLLHQILAQHKDLIPVVFHEKWYATRIAGNVVDRTTPEIPLAWNWSELYGAFTRVTNEQFLEEQGIAMRLCMFVDGMDEYRTFEDPSLSPNELITRKKKGYTDIAELFRHLAKSRVIKICLSSRHLVEFKDAFGASSHKLKLEDLTYDDIKNYTTQVLEKNFRWRALTAQVPIVGRQLITNIVDKALGVFLWVVLVTHLLLDGLQDGDKLAELQTQLDSMPVELGGKDGLYALMMRNIKLEHRRQCFEILQLIRCSLGPPTLLSLALADGELRDFVTNGNQTILAKQVDRVGYVLNQMEDRLNSRCAGLVEVVKDFGVESEASSNKVQFMHQTAKDFVEQSQVWKEYLPHASGSFNPHFSLLASRILELKLIKSERLNRTGTEMVRGIVNDAMVYAFRNEKFTHRANPELLDELDRYVQYFEAWTNVHLRRKFPRGDRFTGNMNANILTCAAEHGLMLYISSKLQAKGPNTEFLAEEFHLLRFVVEAWTAEECQLNPDLVEMLLNHSDNPLTRRTMGVESIIVWSALVEHVAGMDPQDLRWERWKKIAAMFVKRLRSLGQISKVEDLLGQSESISPLSVSFVRQQLKEKAEQLAIESPLQSQGQRPSERPSRGSKRQKNK